MFRVPPSKPSAPCHRPYGTETFPRVRTTVILTKRGKFCKNRWKLNKDRKITTSSEHICVLCNHLPCPHVLLSRLKVHGLLASQFNFDVTITFFNYGIHKLIMMQEAHGLTGHVGRVNYTRGFTPKRVTNGRANLRDLTPVQHSSEETSQRWRAVSDTVSDLTDPGFEPQTSRTESVSFKHDESKLVILNTRAENSHCEFNAMHLANNMITYLVQNIATALVQDQMRAGA